MKCFLSILLSSIYISSFALFFNTDSTTKKNKLRLNNFEIGTTYIFKNSKVKTPFAHSKSNKQFYILSIAKHFKLNKNDELFEYEAHTIMLTTDYIRTYNDNYLNLDAFYNMLSFNSIYSGFFQYAIGFGVANSFIQENVPIHQVDSNSNLVIEEYFDKKHYVNFSATFETGFYLQKHLNLPIHIGFSFKGIFSDQTLYYPHTFVGLKITYTHAK